MKSFVLALLFSFGFIFTSCNSDATVPNETVPADSVQAVQPDSTVQTETGGNVTSDTTATN